MTAIVVCLLTVYVGGYWHLSRRGMAESKKLGVEYFFYVPYEGILDGSIPADERKLLLRNNTRLQLLYLPLQRLEEYTWGLEMPAGRS